MRTRCDVQRERALDQDERLPCGAFALLDEGIAGSLWALRSACEAAERDDAERYLEVWLTYEQALVEQFGVAPNRGDDERAALHVLRRERDPGPLITASDARKLQRLARDLGDDVRVSFVDASVLTAVARSAEGPVCLVAEWRRRRYVASVACPVRRRAPLWSAIPAPRRFGRAPRQVERAFTFAGSPIYWGRGVPEALQKLLACDAAPRIWVADGMARIDWSHPTRDPLAHVLRLLEALRAHAGARQPSGPSAEKRRYRRWPPPAKR